jgi:ArsR family transcriptional regulator, arsenate/arsenite/antimonite-responsive transcriptional repressor
MNVDAQFSQRIDLCQYLGCAMSATKTKRLRVSETGLCCGSVTDAPLAEDEASELARVLGALADPVRLRLLSLVASQVEICSCDLEVPLGKSQPTISHHTKVLAEAGLLVGEKRGRWMWWRVAPDRLTAVRKALGG